MAFEDRADPQAARTAAREVIPQLLASGSEDTLRLADRQPGIRRDARVSCSSGKTSLRFAARRNQQAQDVARELSRTAWPGAHPHTPSSLIAMRLLRELHLMDLVRSACRPLLEWNSAPGGRARPKAIAATALGQKLMLARRGSTRIAAGARRPWAGTSDARGPRQFVSDRIATVEDFASVASSADCRGGKSRQVVKLVHIRVALLRHPHTPPDRVPALVPGSPRREIEGLLELRGFRKMCAVICARNLHLEKIAIAEQGMKM
jgi:hypothetical protein